MRKQRALCVFFSLYLLTTSSAETLTDQAIADAIRDAYLVDQGIDVNRIVVKVTDGIVELKGTVNNILSRERATYVTELVKGVRAVSNRVRVLPARPRSDAEIQKAVRQALRLNPATSTHRVEVAVNDGKVKLTGTVESNAQKRLMSTVAKGVRGVLGLSNYLTVELDAKRTDAEIQPEIEQVLRWDALVDDSLVRVDVDRGIATLSGTVGSAAEKRRAQWDAWVDGVREVDSSRLEVNAFAKSDDLREGKYVLRTDREIAQVLRRALLYDPRVISSKVRPEVKDGLVTLRGSVESLQGRRAAEAVSRNTTGVTRVTNQLEIRPSARLSDEEIRNQLKWALAENPYTDSHQIRVIVREGAVTLSGQVETAVEKSEASRLAAQVRGVTSIHNQLSTTTGGQDVRSAFDFPWYVPAPVFPAEPTSDQEIHERIRKELWWSPFVDSDHVKVEVVNGVAILSGTVDSWREYDAADDNAREGGANRVINRLKVHEPRT